MQARDRLMLRTRERATIWTVFELTDWNYSDSLSKDTAWRSALSLQWWSFHLLSSWLLKDVVVLSFNCWLDLGKKKTWNLRHKFWYTVTQLNYYNYIWHTVSVFLLLLIVTVWICIVLILLSHYICSFGACVVLVASIWSSWGTVILSVIPAHSGCTTSIPYFDRAWPGTTPSTLSLSRSLSLALWSQPPQDPISITLG